VLADKVDLVGERPFLGFIPYDVSDAGSDRHRAYLTRLCCVFRLSQPLDALIPPASPRLCFMPYPSLGFCSQRFPPSSCRHGFRRALPLLSLATPKRRSTSGVDAPGGSVHHQSVLPVTSGPILSQPLSPIRDSRRVSALHRCRASSHGLSTT
jgi:hypothetical protein